MRIRRHLKGSLGSGYPRRPGGNSIEDDLKDFINSPANSNKCGECSNTFPTWCSINLGVLLCGRCASVHRKILNSRDDSVFSDLKSLSMDKWTDSDLDYISSSGGNKGNTSVWNPRHEPFPFDGDDDKSKVEMFILEKYVLGKFRYDEVKPEDFGDYRNREHSFGDSYSGDRYSSEPRSRRNSGNIYGRRNSEDTYNQNKFGNDEYLQRRNTHLEDRRSASPLPSLPTRPRPDKKPKDSVFDGFSSPAAVDANPVNVNPANVVQQYLDPVTGIIYVDQSQYLLAQQQQQQAQVQQAQLQQAQLQQAQLQQAQMQQAQLQQAQLQQAQMQQAQLQQAQFQQAQLQQAQLQQQATKNSIMNLYNTGINPNASFGQYQPQ